MVKVGQVWKDQDERSCSRLIKVIRVSKQFVYCQDIRTRRKSRIRKDRMKPGSRGYGLMKFREGTGWIRDFHEGRETL